MPKKIPMRTCIGCGQVRQKKDLIRIVRTPEGNLLVDRTGRTNGRGAYLCRNPECLEKAFRRKSLNRAFAAEISAEDVNAVREELTQIMAQSGEGRNASVGQETGQRKAGPAATADSGREGPE